MRKRSRSRLYDRNRHGLAKFQPPGAGFSALFNISTTKSPELWESKHVYTTTATNVRSSKYMTTPKTMGSEEMIVGGGCHHDYAELFALLERVPCPTHGCNSGSSVAGMATGPGGVSVVELMCKNGLCGTVWNYSTGTKIKLKEGTPFRNPEELGMIVRHLLSKSPGEVLSRQTQSWGAAGVTSKHYQEALEWIYPSIIEVHANSLRKAQKFLEDIEPGTLGSSKRAILGADARWHKRGFDSSHGTVFVMALRGPGITDEAMLLVEQQNLSRNCTEREVKEFGLYDYKQSAREVDRKGSEMAYMRLKALDWTIEASVHDADAGTKYDLKKKKRSSKKKKKATDDTSDDGNGEGKALTTLVEKIVDCVNHRVKNGANDIIKNNSKDAVRRAKCKSACKRKMTKAGVAGKRCANIRCTHRFVRSVLVPAVSRMIRTEIPTPKSQADLDDIQRKWPTLFDKHVLNGHACDHHDETCNHHADWKSKKGSVVTCCGDKDGIKNRMQAKVGNHIHNCFAIGIDGPLTNNTLEAANNIARDWCKKGTNISAFRYHIQMLLAGLAINERFHYEQDPEAPTYKEELWEHLAGRANVAAPIVVAPQHQRAERVQTHVAALRGRQRRTKAKRMQRLKYKHDSKRIKEAIHNTKNARAAYKPTSTRSPREPRSSKQKPCPCGGGNPQKPHYRTSSRDCLWHKSRKKKTTLAEATSADNNDSGSSGSDSEGFRCEGLHCRFEDADKAVVEAHEETCPDYQAFLEMTEDMMQDKFLLDDQVELVDSGEDDDDSSEEESEEESEGESEEESDDGSDDSETEAPKKKQKRKRNSATSKAKGKEKKQKKKKKKTKETRGETQKQQQKKSKGKGQQKRKKKK